MKNSFNKAVAFFLASTMALASGAGMASGQGSKYEPMPEPESAKASGNIGEIQVDGIGNIIKLRALTDPQVDGVTCHLTSFERGTASKLIGLLAKQNPFEDPSNSSIACRQTGPITIKNIDMSIKGEDIFLEKISAVFKSLAVERFYDCKNDTLIYISHSRQLIEGSAKQAVSSVPLYNSGAKWANDKPACGQ